MSPPGARSGVAPSEADIAIWHRSAEVSQRVVGGEVRALYMFASSARGGRHPHLLSDATNERLTDSGGFDYDPRATLPRMAGRSRVF